MTEDQMAGWHHRLDGHESEQAPGVGDGQGSLSCCSSWGQKESGATERLNNNSWGCGERRGLERAHQELLYRHFLGTSFLELRHHLWETEGPWRPER